jgi:hypothetical protein
MSLGLLMDALVREASGLIAAVATHQGARVPLSQVSERLFHGLATELEKLNVKRRVGADMFAMAPRAYIRKLRRAEESATDRGRSLWEAVYEHIVAQGQIPLSALGERFHRDDGEVLRGVLSDLRESGMVDVSGRGPGALYSAGTGAELGARLGTDPAGTDELLWAVIYREAPVSKLALQRLGAISPAELDLALQRLVTAGRVSEDADGSEVVYRSSLFTPPRADTHGWEGAIFDHFHAVVKTLYTFLTNPDAGASAASTYTFDLWPGHPMSGEVEALFSELRARASTMRESIDEYNRDNAQSRQTERTILYLGLCGEATPKRPTRAPSTPPDDE